MSGKMLNNVKYGDPNLVPSFWLNEDWNWSLVKKKLSNIKTDSYTGPGNFQDFLSRLISNCLSQSGKNPETYVLKNIDPTVHKKRLKF